MKKILISFLLMAMIAGCVQQGTDGGREARRTAGC